MDPETQALVFKSNDKLLIKRTALLIIAMIFSILFLNWTSSKLLSYVPILPSFSLISASTNQQFNTRQHIYDLNASFIVHNPNKNDLIFKSLKNSVELPRSSAMVASFTLRNATVKADGGSGYSTLKFGFLGRAKYKGKAWFMKEISIEVVCEQENVLVYNKNNHATNRGVTFGPIGLCRVDGLWFTVYLCLIGVVLLIFLVCIVVFFVFLAVEANRHEFVKVMTQYGIAWKDGDGEMKTF